MSDLIDIVYVSSAVRLLSDAELLEILRVSRRNNERDGITGMLLYDNGVFMQVLEGAPDVVDRTYERIRADARHKGVTLLLRSSIDERLFGEWSMTFQDMRAVPEADRPATNRFLHGDEPGEGDAADPDRVRDMLRTFRALMH